MAVRYVTNMNNEPRVVLEQLEALIRDTRGRRYPFQGRPRASPGNSSEMLSSKCGLTGIYETETQEELDQILSVKRARAEDFLYRNLKKQEPQIPQWLFVS